MTALVIGVLLAGAAGLLVGFWLGRRGRSLPTGAVEAPAAEVVAPSPLRLEPCPPQRCEDLALAPAVRALDLPELLPMHPSSPRLGEQPLRWRAEMRRHGEALLDGWVGEVTFVHGSFVGSDPLSLLIRLQALTPRWHGRLHRHLAAVTKGATDLLTRDAGNFGSAYVRLFADATRLPCSGFVWSSENSHLARLEAAISLIEHLARRLDGRADTGRAILVGHSHAGQVFALLLQLLHQVEHAPVLLEVAERLGTAPGPLARALDRLRAVELFVVTLGTPARYGWPKSAQDRLLHIINHRGPGTLGGRMDGVPWTRDGDYVQQWGIAGSDLPVAGLLRRDLDRVLEPVLGAGCAARSWVGALRHRRRVHDGGLNLLVNYRDDDPRRRPNFLATNFGHSIYTRRRTMAFLASTLVEHFGDGGGAGADPPAPKQAEGGVQPSYSSEVSVFGGS